jgi:DNA-binding NarL/FixJ family response regulator
MPSVNGIAATREIRKRGNSAGIILLTAHQGEDLFRAAVEAGANGYLMKDNALLEITNGIRAVASGGYYFTQSLGALFKQPQQQAAAADTGPDLLAPLVPVERRIVQMIASQHSTRDIASELGLSIRTIENRRALICEKLGISGANALLKFALDHKHQLV